MRACIYGQLSTYTRVHVRVYTHVSVCVYLICAIPYGEQYSLMHSYTFSRIVFTANNRCKRISMLHHNPSPYTTNTRGKVCATEEVAIPLAPSHPFMGTLFLLWKAFLFLVVSNYYGHLTVLLLLS